MSSVLRRRFVILGMLLLVPALTLSRPVQADAKPPTPVLAYFYQWFDPSSWNRAKIDYPAVGRYSSDDPAVMREQVRSAKSAGIDAFVVSWKDTATNDRRLRVLMDVARSEDFKLAMIYQGLDFARDPQPVDRVLADFKLFASDFADDSVFLRMGGKPLTIWSGTWAFSHDDVAKVTSAVRDRMLVLSTEKSVAGYKRLADVTDGDAYYWSSVNPDTNDNYEQKFQAMAAAIHADNHYWIASFAPGFDARLVGGTKAVDRADGKTLQREYQVAVASSPDALGLISWNEFSENTYVEPSAKYGDRYLSVLKALLLDPAPAAPADSSEVAAPTSAAQPLPVGNLLLLVCPTVILIGGATVLARKRRARHP